MGINRPSLYAAFGNKEALFRKALDRYAEGPASYVKTALAMPTAREIAEQLLRGSIEMIGKSENPRGCLVIQSALACGDEAAPVRDELVSALLHAGGSGRPIPEGEDAGEFPKGTDTARLARYIATVDAGHVRAGLQRHHGGGNARHRRPSHARRPRQPVLKGPALLPDLGEVAETASGASHSDPPGQSPSILSSTPERVAKGRADFDLHRKSWRVPPFPPSHTPLAHGRGF
ncbi:MAG: TetR/AcrR family transcriptional regulator [Luteolibacter sp.]